MSDPKHSPTSAREEFERIRQQVRLAPPPEFANAPEWLHGIEEMRDFFDSTARHWDSVFGAGGADPLYDAVASEIAPTDEPVRLLLLGCGTGLELTPIFQRIPNARVTGIDVAPGMLAELRRKFAAQSNQLELIEGSYLDVDLGQQRYDYAVATLTVHHVPPGSKLVLYKCIREAFKAGGRYIEGDQSTDPAGEQKILYWYQTYIAQLPGGDRAAWNYDVTLSPQSQRRLLAQAGFQNIQLTWQSADRDMVVFTAVQ